MAGERGKERARPAPKEESPSLRYREAMEELEEILQSIESEDVDIDDLSWRVERAADLVKLCREKIRSTEERVRTVLEAFSGEVGETSPDGAEGPAGPTEIGKTGTEPSGESGDGISL